MTDEERLTTIEDEIRKLKDNKKDKWDKFSIASSIFIPLAIAGVGGAYSFFSQKAETEVARIQAASESKIKQAELVSKFFDPLTGTDDRKREFAVDSLLVAAPDYGPVLVRVVSKTDPYSVKALDQRRDLLIRQMFGDDADSRRDAYTQLLSSWGNDESLITALIAYGSSNKSNENGIYNTVVLLSYMQSDTIMKKKSEILIFASSVEGNGPKTKERVEVLRSRLKG